DRVVSAHDCRDAAGGRLGPGLLPDGFQRGQEVVGDDGGVAGVDELASVEGDDAVLVDPVELALLDAHLHPAEVAADLVGRVAGPRPAEGRGAVVGRPDEGDHGLAGHVGGGVTGSSSWGRAWRRWPPAWPGPPARA